MNTHNPFPSLAPVASGQEGGRSKRRQGRGQMIRQPNSAGLQYQERVGLGLSPPCSGKVKEGVRIPGSSESATPQHTQNSNNYVPEPRAELVAAQGHPTVRGKVRTRNQLLSWVSSSSHHNWGLGPLTLEEGMGLPQELSIILVETPE